MTTLGIIGGTGLGRMQGLEITRREMVKTPFGAPSCPLVFGRLGEREVAFLARHGHAHAIPPHRINYRANVWALHSVGIRRILAIGAVGGIAPECTTGRLVVPDQIIDYTEGRIGSFHDGPPDVVRHVDFSYPYDAELREAILDGAREASIDAIDGGVYGATQGPRLETVAEIKRLERDGCTLVGMTGMPEAALAREVGIAYATCAVVVNPAAGKGDGAIDLDDLANAVSSGMQTARDMLTMTVVRIED